MRSARPALLRRVRSALPLAALLLAAACGDGAGSDRGADISDATASLTLYFTDVDELRRVDCGAVAPVRRAVPDSLATPDGALRLLLSGVTSEEAARGLSSQFQPHPAVGTDQPLVDYLVGLELREGVAWLDFEPGALAYLNGAACLQASVKAPIEWTLRGFTTIDSVGYRIRGRPFDDWDA